MAYSLPEKTAMNVLDIFIIYLACGAPVGVYFYLQNRRRLFSKQLWLKTILNFVFWVPLLLQIIQRSKTVKNLFKTKAEFRGDSNKKAIKLALLQKRLEKTLLENRVNFSIYEFREVFERFVGLSLALSDSNKNVAAHEKEIFLIGNRKSAETSARCFHRRNLKRLSFHQTEAEKDFLRMITVFSNSLGDLSEIRDLTGEVLETLKNYEAQTELGKIFAVRWQIFEENAVRKLEKDLWNSEAHKPQPAKSISMKLPTISLKANLFSKD